MKTFKILAVSALCAMTLSSCGDKLNVHNPNYFTEEEMKEYLADNPDALNSIVSGLTTNLYTYIGLYSAAINASYSNSGAYESYKAFQRICQAGDVIEGDAQHTGTFTTWYQNLSSNTYWERSQDVNNYGYYYAAVAKVAPAMKALDFLTEDYVEANPSLGYSRAQALTLKALAYTELMERYTDLTDPTSTTKQGWPVYEEYAVSAPKEPLSVKDTWDYIMDLYEEAVELFHKSSLGTQGYTSGETNSNELFDMDCAVCQYNRCRAALDCQRWDVAIEAGEDILKYYTEFIPADAYGMPVSELAEANKRNGVTKDKPEGTSWNKEWTADKNGFLCKALNPETIFGNGTATSGTQYWSVLGLNTLKASPSGYYQMDKNLYDAMSDSDCRKACVLGTAFEGLNVYTRQGADTTWYSYTVPAYTSLKWAATAGLGQTAHTIDNTYANSSWYRSSTVLLMVAEAYAQNNNGTKAQALLDKLLAARTLSGKATMTCANTMSGKSALDMVKLQWRIELWGEGDWAFFNRKRWGETSYTRGANHWSKNDVPASGWIWEIPNTERQGNPYWD